MSGKTLLDQLATLTGLPGDSVNKELLTIVESYGLNPDTLTLQDVRALLADYLQDVLLEAKHEYSQNFDEAHTKKVTLT